jgi:nitrile hydratase
VTHSSHSDLSEIEVRVRALESILAEKGYIDPAAVDAIIEAYETRIGPRNGAQVVEAVTAHARSSTRGASSPNSV